MPVKDTYLAGVLAHVPEAERGKAEAALQALEEGGLRQSDYSKLAAEAKAAQDRFDALYASNTEWFETRKADLAELDTLRTKVKDGVVGEKPVVAADLPKDLVTKADLEKIIADTERGAVGYIADSSLLTLKHFQTFGEVLDTRELLADKRVSTIGIAGVYAEKYKDQLAAKAKAVTDARDEAIREEARVAERAKFANSNHPYPVVGNEPSALDNIEAARAGKAPEAKSLDAIAAEYVRLSGARTGAGA